tara:strand:- start:658 stop:1215 length:558 start_codon:yes stop_codon:yes gene_type:complete
MSYTVTFLDHKLYQSISFDADIKFPDISEYAKKIWILKEYKKAEGKLDLTETSLEGKSAKTHSSYSIEKSFKGDELVVELIENIKFSDNFNYFEESKEEEDTGDKELDNILSYIKESESPHNAIVSLVFGSKNFDTKLNNEQKTLIEELFGLKPPYTKFGDFKHDNGCSYVKDKHKCDCRCSDSE